jgi:hypothetical protein
MGDISQHVNLHAQRRSRAGFYGFLMVAIAIGVAVHTLRPRADARVIALLGGPDALVTLERPDDVDARRIDGKKGQGEVHGYTALGGPVVVDDATTSRLARTLATPGTYLFDSSKRCAFEPGVVVRWRRGPHVLEALLCFSCDEVQFWFDDVAIATEDVDPARGALLALVKPLFPLDEGLQALR